MVGTVPQMLEMEEGIEKVSGFFGTSQISRSMIPVLRGKYKPGMTYFAVVKQR